MKKILESINRRINTEISNHNSIKYLKKLNSEQYISIVISTVYLYTRPKKGLNKNSIYFAEIISALGHGIRSKMKLKRDSSIAAKTGAFILYTFEELEMIQVGLGQGSKGHNSYIVNVLDDAAICKLWEELGPSQIEKLPSEIPYEPWKSVKHPSNLILVKTANKNVLDSLSPETHPIVFNTINKAMQTGWIINKDVYNICSWALRNKTEAFSDIWEQQNVQAKATKIREAKTITDMARRFIDKTFYHIYYYDFRGRKYPATAYLHEQGSDLARGLLLRSDSKSIGKDGFFWLLVSAANTWAGDSGINGRKTDKIPIKARYEWALDNEEILLSYAENPKVNQGWMKADKPWQFIAICFEIMKVRIWQTSINDFSNFDFNSHLEAFIDGSNNGAQHLSALTKDEITAPHVNLVPLEFPGDLYKYVADHVWQNIESIVDNMDKDKLKECERVIDNLIELKKQITAAEPKSDLRKTLVDKIKDYKQKNEDILAIASPIFWNRIKDIKQRRKIVKRNVMTLPYGGTAYGLGEQQISDAKKHNIDVLYYMEHRWGAYMGREVYEDCRESLQKPMQLLETFEEAGSKAELKGEFLSWKVPITNFPVVQHYTEGKVKKIWVQYGPPIGNKLNTGYYINTLQIAICFLEDTKPSKGKQSQGAAPNCIHSLDAAHLMITVDKCPFPVTTVHDSFGCLLADMPELYKIIRQTFVELYKSDPLKSLMTDIQGDLKNVEIGNLDIESILESEYAFS